MLLRTEVEAKTEGSTKAGKCFNCGQVGHINRGCPEMANGDTNEMSVVTDMVNGDSNKGIANVNQDSVFAVGKDDRQLTNSRVTDHMPLRRGGMFEYKEISVDMHVIITDGKKIRVAGTGSVCLEPLASESKWPKFFTYLDLTDDYSRSENLPNETWVKQDMHHLGQVEGDRFGEEDSQCVRIGIPGKQGLHRYSMIGSKWELWHARVEHLNEASLADSPGHTRNTDDSTEG
ncbi:LOW QUALITY PROTEIN: polyprotein [Phytophthora palmivora]|uniref:Polyprotein n=1 Tax=Phytophthora palmivora TaxID=4796 RepID=A0A2P4X5A7_9STRA|nr:LOW QUALITY PROTEIN: polyprotein [Phytophthora palmivora]